MTELFRGNSVLIDVDLAGCTFTFQHLEKLVCSMYYFNCDPQPQGNKLGHLVIRTLHFTFYYSKSTPAFMHYVHYLFAFVREKLGTVTPIWVL